MPPPKRMSDILASSSIDTRINSTPIHTAPYSSEGPTLPIIGVTSEHSTKLPENGKKRKRTTTDKSTKPNKAVAVEGEDQTTQQRPRTNHPSLYEPWILLPEKPRKAVEVRGSQNIVPVVYSKNQNVKSGINKLKQYLGVQQDENSDLPTALKDVEGTIAVSAQSEGTVKLVGIVDMAKRIVGEKSHKAAGRKEQSGGEGTKWYTYTVLSSVVVPRKQNTANDADEAQKQDGKDGEAMDIDGDDQAVKETQERSTEEGATKTVPVLTVWMTRKRIPSFRDAFGEQEFTGYAANDD